MVSNLTAAFCAVTLVISLVLPVAALIFFARKHRRQGIVSGWLLGAAGFFVTQILIRVPILTALQGTAGFAAFARDHLFAYAFCLAFTAGLFELAGRFAVAKWMRRKNLTLRRSLAAGMGHGGIEAMLLVGITYINNLAYIAMINSGTFDATLAQAIAAGIDVSQLELIRQQLLTASPVLFLLGGFERLLAMVCHTAMSLLVCYGIAHGKSRSCALICLGIHTLLDLTAGISMLAGTALSQTAAYCIIYTILTAAAAVSAYLICALCRRWRKESHHAEEL